jgi:acetyl esterase/lipase
VNNVQPSHRRLSALAAAFADDPKRLAIGGDSAGA